MPSGLENVDDSAFAYCLSLPRTLPDFILPGAIRSVEADAFSSTAPRFVWIPSPEDDGSVTIAAGAFAPCRNLKFIRLPSDCEITGPGAFPAGTIILGASGSPANDYADQYGYLFVPLTSVGGNG